MALLPNAGILAFISSAKNKMEYFISGFAGYGWKIWEWMTGRYKLEIDDLTVRRTMTVYELIISKIRSIVGSMAITQAHGKIKKVDNTSDPANYLITLEDTNSFAQNDFIRMQEFTGGQRSYWVKISEIRGEMVVIPKSEFDNEISTPDIGDEVIQFGNETNTARQSAIYIHADEGGQPAIDVMFGIDSKSFDGKTKLRLGASLPGAPDQYKGLYCENGMLKFTDASGKVTSCLWPDGTAELGAGSAKFNPDKSGFLAGGAIAWRWDAAKSKYVCTMSDVVLTWDNLSDEVKENLKGKDAPYYVYAYKTASAQPSTPSGVQLPPEGWSQAPTAPEKDSYTWMTQVKVSGTGAVGEWSTPVRISGMTGEPGADATDVEFIYQQTKTGNSPAQPETSQEDDCIPEGWTDSPKGVTSTYMYEWVCVRHKNEVWGEFSVPALWAKYGVDANLLPWVEEWNNNKTLIGDEYVISPKMFSGIKNDDETLTGVAFGHGVVTIDGVERTGLFGIVDDEIVFEIDPITKTYKFKGIVNATDGVFNGTINADNGRIGQLYIRNDGIGSADSHNQIQFDAINDRFLILGDIEHHEHVLFHGHNMHLGETFGFAQLATIVAHGTYGYYYPRGYNSIANVGSVYKIRVNFRQQTASNGVVYYTIPLYDKGRPAYDGRYNFIQFNNTSEYTYEIDNGSGLNSPEVGSTYILFNGNDRVNVKYWQDGKVRTLGGGLARTIIQTDTALLNPSVATNLIGAGLRVISEYDNN